MLRSRGSFLIRRNPAWQPTAWLLLACGLAGCASPAPAPRLYALHLAPRIAADAPGAAAP